MAITERQAIRIRLEGIKQERKELAEEYWALLDRLNKLDEGEREMIDFQGTLDTLNQVTTQLAQLLPKVPVQTIAEHITKNTRTTVTTEETEESSNISVRQIEDQKEFDSRQSKFTKKRAYKKNEEVKEVVVEKLREFGRPVKGRELFAEIEKDTGWRWNNNTNLMNQLMKQDNRIERVSKGYYQSVY